MYIYIYDIYVKYIRGFFLSKTTITLSYLPNSAIMLSHHLIYYIYTFEFSRVVFLQLLLSNQNLNKFHMLFLADMSHVSLNLLFSPSFAPFIC